MSYSIHEFRDVASHKDLPEPVVSGLETCIASAFGGGISQQDARDHMAGEQVLVAQVDIDGVPVVKGFSATSIVSRSVPDSASWSQSQPIESARDISATSRKCAASRWSATSRS